MKTKKTGYAVVEIALGVLFLSLVAAIILSQVFFFSQGARIASTKGGLSAVRATLAIKYAQSAGRGKTASYPPQLRSTDFVDGFEPKNSLIGGGSGVIALEDVPANIGTHTYGFWYVPTGKNAGRAGAFAGSGKDAAVDVSVF